MERVPRSGRAGTVRQSSSVRSAGGNFVAMAATRTGIGQRDETGWGEEEDVVTTAAKMLSREGAVHDATWGGGCGRCKALSSKHHQPKGPNR